MVRTVKGEQAVKSISFPFIIGGNNLGVQTGQFIFAAANPKGWEIDAANEWAIAVGQLPPECLQVIRIKVWGVALADPGPGNTMLLTLTGNAGASHEVYTTEAITVVNHPSVELDPSINDVIHWTITDDEDPDVDDIQGGDSFELRVDYNGAFPPHIATDAVIRTCEIDYLWRYPP